MEQRTHVCACVRAVHTHVPRWLWGVGGGRGTRGEGRAPGQACVAHACAPGGALKSSTHLCRARTPPGPHHHSGTQPKPPGGRPCSGGGGWRGGHRCVTPMGTAAMLDPPGDTGVSGSPPLVTPVGLGTAVTLVPPLGDSIGVGGHCWGWGTAVKLDPPWGHWCFWSPPLMTPLGLGTAVMLGPPPTLVTPLGSGTAVILGPHSVTLVGLGDSSDAGFPPPGTLVFLVPPPLGDTGGAGGQQ